MSLTKLLKILKVKEQFKNTFVFDPPILDATLKASPLTKNYAIVGTAFDYLLRFYIERLNTKVIKRKWVAESAVSRWESGSLQLSHVLDEVENFDGGNMMKAFLDGAKRAHDDYLYTGILNDNIIKFSIILAQLDVFKRARKIVPDLGIVMKEDMDDLRNLMQLVQPKFFKSRKAMVLNPTFGKGSRLVGGADADLIIGDTLIEIKTTKDPQFKRDYFFQLVGYYILYLMGGVDGIKNPMIKNLAIYFSRYGVLYKIPVSSFSRSSDFDRFIKWFKRTACTYSKIVTDECYCEYIKIIQEKLSGTDEGAIALREQLSKSYRVKISNSPSRKEIKLLYSKIAKHEKGSARKIFERKAGSRRIVSKYAAEGWTKFKIDTFFKLGNLAS